MLEMEVPLTVLVAWTCVVAIGSFSASLGLLLLLKFREQSKSQKTGGLKALTGAKPMVPGLKTLTLDTSDQPKTQPEAETIDEGENQEEEEEESEEGDDLVKSDDLVESDEELTKQEVCAVEDKSFLLPPRQAGDPRRLTVVLDLDETLVRSCEEGDTPIELEIAASIGALQRYASYTFFAFLEVVFRIKIQCEDPEGGAPERIMSFLRPGVFQFLKQLSSFAEVVVFTAGDVEYASPLVAHLDPESKTFQGSLYRDSTVKTIFHDHVKDLSCLGRDPRYTVLVDNNPFSFLFQPDNGILCQPFYGDPSDQHLLQVVLPLLKFLACVGDVRPILRQRYISCEKHRILTLFLKVQSFCLVSSISLEQVGDACSTELNLFLEI